MPIPPDVSSLDDWTYCMCLGVRLPLALRKLDGRYPSDTLH